MILCGGPKSLMAPLMCTMHVLRGRGEESPFVVFSDQHVTK